MLCTYACICIYILHTHIYVAPCRLPFPVCFMALIMMWAPHPQSSLLKLSGTSMLLVFLGVIVLSFLVYWKINNVVLLSLEAKHGSWKRGSKTLSLSTVGQPDSNFSALEAALSCHGSDMQGIFHGKVVCITNFSQEWQINLYLSIGQWLPKDGPHLWVQFLLAVVPPQLII